MSTILLLLDNVLLTNTNAGVTWSLLGPTIGLAQGLDQAKRHASSSVWWFVLWKDSFLSITLERAASTSCAGDDEAPLGIMSPPDCRACIECVSWMPSVGLDVLGRGVFNSTRASSECDYNSNIHGKNMKMGGSAYYGPSVVGMRIKSTDIASIFICDFKSVPCG